MDDKMTIEEGLAAVVAQPIVPLQPFYDRDGITIYNAKCETVLPHLEDCDLVCTDPPYGIGENANKQRTRQGHGMAAQRDYGAYDWDGEPPPTWLLDQAISKGSNAIVWGGNHLALGGRQTCWLVWDKDNGETDFADCELAWTNLRRAVRKFRWRWQGMLQEKAGDKKEVRVHPTQKPLALMKWCLGLVPDAKTVLDPFMGSGTTLVAAKQLGLRAVGIEINADYCAAAVERLRQNVFEFRED